MKQNKNIVIGLIVLLGIVGVVSAVPSVQLIDSNANDYLNVYEYNTSIHNNLSGLQGGVAGEYYHLTLAEHSDISTLLGVNGTYLPLTGGTMTGDINMNGNSLTSVGKLIMSGLTNSYDIIPVTHNLYSLGNSTHWWAKAYITDLYASSIDTTDLTSTNIDSTNLDSVNIDSNNINGTNIESEVLDVENNISLGSFVMKDDGADMIIILT